MKIKLTKIEKPDFSEVKELVEDYIVALQDKDATSDGLDDYMHYIFESAIEAVYGKDCWNEINKILIDL